MQRYKKEVHMYKLYERKSMRVYAYKRTYMYSLKLCTYVHTYIHTYTGGRAVDDRGGRHQGTYIHIHIHTYTGGRALDDRGGRHQGIDSGIYAYLCVCICTYIRIA